MGIIKRWRQRELIATVAGEITANMDQACQFVVGQARSKVKRRTGTLASEIDYEVKAKGLTVTGYVGVKKGKAFYGRFVELGTSKMAASPFLRPSVYENGERITRILAGKG